MFDNVNKIKYMLGHYKNVSFLSLAKVKQLKAMFW